MSYGQPLQEGDRIWLTRRDGVCLQGWWTLRCVGDTWYFRYGDNYASVMGLSILLSAMFELILCGGLLPHHSRDNVDCMLEQAFAEGLLPLRGDRSV